MSGIKQQDNRFIIKTMKRLESKSFDELYDLYYDCKLKIQNNVSVYEGVELDDFVFCGPSMVFTNIKLPRSEFPQRGNEFYLKTYIGKSVSIGANATIVCGITIGEYSLIGAGAVVTKDIPPYSLVVGNPGRIIGKVDKYGNKI